MMTLEELNKEKLITLKIRGWEISAIKFWLEMLPTNYNCREIQIKNVRNGQYMTGAMTHYDNQIEEIRKMFNEIVNKYNN